MKTGDKVAIFGTLTSIENINATVVVDGPNGVKLTLKVFPECLELAADQRITVPEYVKNDLDEAITSELDSLDVARVYLNDGMMFSLDTKLWIDKHRTAFMYALVYGYKAETIKRYNVVAWIDPSGETRDLYWCRSFAEGVDVTHDKSGDDDMWTLTQIKEYGLEGYERVEVQDEA